MDLSPNRFMKHVTSPQQKNESRNAAYRVKFGSPKLRDLLREKCRIRVKEARGNRFDCGRPSENKTFYQQILRQEIKNVLDTDFLADLDLQEQIFQELNSEIDEWFLDEIEREENYWIEESENNPIICPICLKSALRVQHNCIVCDCGVRFNGTGGIQNFHETIKQHVSNHELKCDRTLMFFTEVSVMGTLNLALNGICNDCDYFCVIAQ